MTLPLKGNSIALLSRLVTQKCKNITVSSKIDLQNLELSHVPVPICRFNHLENKIDSRYHYCHQRCQTFMPLDAISLRNVIVPTIDHTNASVIWSGQAHGKHEYNLGIQHQIEHEDMIIHHIGTLEVGCNEIEMAKLAKAADESVNDLIVENSNQKMLNICDKMRIFDSLDKKVGLDQYQLYPYAVRVLVPFLGDVFSDEKIVVKTSDDDYVTYTRVLDVGGDINSNVDSEAKNEAIISDDEKNLSVRVSCDKIMEFQTINDDNNNSANKLVASEDIVVKPNDIIRVKVSPCLLYYRDLSDDLISFMVIPINSGLNLEDCDRNITKYVCLNIDDGKYYAEGSARLKDDSHLWNHRPMMGIMKSQDVPKCHHRPKGVDVAFSDEFVEYFGCLPGATACGLDIISCFKDFPCNLENTENTDDDLEQMCVDRIQHDIDVYIVENDGDNDNLEIIDKFSHLKEGDTAVIHLGLDLPQERQWHQHVTISSCSDEKHQVEIDTNYFGLHLKLKVPKSALIDPKLLNKAHLKYYSMECPGEDDSSFDVTLVTVD